MSQFAANSLFGVYYFNHHVLIASVTIQVVELE